MDDQRQRFSVFQLSVWFLSSHILHKNIKCVLYDVAFMMPTNGQITTPGSSLSRFESAVCSGNLI